MDHLLVWSTVVDFTVFCNIWVLRIPLVITWFAPLLLARFLLSCISLSLAPHCEYFLMAAQSGSLSVPSIFPEFVTRARAVQSCGIEMFWHMLARSSTIVGTIVAPSWRPHHFLIRKTWGVLESILMWLVFHYCAKKLIPSVSVTALVGY